MLYICPKAWSMQFRKLTYGLSNESKRLILNYILLKRSREDFKKIIDKRISK